MAPACEPDNVRLLTPMWPLNYGSVTSRGWQVDPATEVSLPRNSIAIAALEDKIVQRATAAVLNTIYEEDFLGFSYGFRPKRSQHDALDALVVGTSSTKVNWILEVDVRSFFDENQ
jgi:retron-type reverse transcriptase